MKFQEFTISVKTSVDSLGHSYFIVTISALYKGFNYASTGLGYSEFEAREKALAYLSAAIHNV